MNLSIPSVGDLFHIWRSKSVRKRRCFVWTSEHPKVARTHQFFHILNENAFRATAACKIAPKLRCFAYFELQTCFAPQRRAIFQIVTSKIAPRRRCFVHFDLKMRFAPQRRAIFPGRNFKNGSGNVVFCTFWLENALRARAACHFSFLCRRRTTSAPAALASLLSGTTNHWKKHSDSRLS